MDADQQHLDTLITAFRDNASVAHVAPLATPSVLRIADADGKRALNWALELQDDPKVIKLVISCDPQALVSVVCGVRVWVWYNGMPVENRFGNHNEVYRLLCDCYNAFKQHRFPRLIELCGTSETLEALVAAHVDDDMSLLVLCLRQSWNKVLARIKQLSAQAAVTELFCQGEYSATTFAAACDLEAPVDVLESMLAKLGVQTRNILCIADIHLRLPLHYIARNHPDPAVVKLLVRHYPRALLAKDISGDTPLDDAIESNESAAAVALLRELTAARRETIALRTTLLLCIKHGYVYPCRRGYRKVLETELAFDMLNDNVWSHIMTFL